MHFGALIPAPVFPVIRLMLLSAAEPMHAMSACKHFSSCSQVLHFHLVAFFKHAYTQLLLLMSTGPKHHCVALLVQI